MKNGMIFILLNCYVATASACPFEGLQLSELTDSPHFASGTELPTAFPTALFELYEKSLSPFDTQECAQAVRIREITHKPSDSRYFAIYTNEDRCDGGNTYGLILKSAESKVGQVVALVQDSFIFCQ